MFVTKSHSLLLISLMSVVSLFGQVFPINVEGEYYTKREYESSSKLDKGYSEIYKKNKKNIVVNKYWGINIHDSLIEIIHNDVDTVINYKYKILSSEFSEDKLNKNYFYTAINICRECSDGITLEHIISKLDTDDKAGGSHFLFTHYNRRLKPELILFKYY